MSRRIAIVAAVILAAALGACTESVETWDLGVRNQSERTVFIDLGFVRTGDREDYRVLAGESAIIRNGITTDQPISVSVLTATCTIMVGTRIVSGQPLMVEIAADGEVSFGATIARMTSEPLDPSSHCLT